MPEGLPSLADCLCEALLFVTRYLALSLPIIYEAQVHNNVLQNIRTLDLPHLKGLNRADNLPRRPGQDREAIVHVVEWKNKNL